MKKAVVLFSGGLDSLVAAGVAIRDGFAPLLLFVDYGQRSLEEDYETAQWLSDWLNFDYEHAPPGGRSLELAKYLLPGINPLQARYLELPERDDPKEVSKTYVPSRNLILLGLAAALAEEEGARHIYTGFNVNDARGYPVPDGRLEFVRAMELALLLGTKCGIEGDPIKIVCPLIDKDKTETVVLGNELGLPLGMSRSCFEGGTGRCRRCTACRLRAKAFKKAGLTDSADLNAG